MYAASSFTAQVQHDKKAGMYIGYVPELPGAHTQAKGLDELYVNFKEVITLCLEELSTEELEGLPEFVGLQQIAVDI